MARPEETARDHYLSLIGAIPGIFACRSEVVLGAHFQRSLPDGYPDVTVCVNGNVILQEWKSARGVLKPAQVRFHAAWVAAGGTVWICRDPLDTVRRMVPLATGETRNRLIALL